VSAVRVYIAGRPAWRELGPAVGRSAESQLRGSLVQGEPGAAEQVRRSVARDKAAKAEAGGRE
jgi:hypothetical protein